MNVFHSKLAHHGDGGLFNHALLVAAHHREMDARERESRVLAQRLAVANLELDAERARNLDLQAVIESLRAQLRAAAERVEIAEPSSESSVEEPNPWVVVDSLE